MACPRLTMLVLGVSLFVFSSGVWAQEEDPDLPPEIIDQATAPYTGATSTYSHSGLDFSLEYPSHLTAVEFGARRDGYVLFVPSSGPTEFESTLFAHPHAQIRARYLSGGASGIGSDSPTNPNGVPYEISRVSSGWMVTLEGSNWHISFVVAGSDEDLVRAIAHSFRLD